MYGILIQYHYAGQQDVWQAAIDEFVSAIGEDDDLGGRFAYSVHVLGDGVSRVHVGRWPDEETLQLVQSRDYFKLFAGQVKAFAGASLQTQRFETRAQTP